MTSKYPRYDEILKQRATMPRVYANDIIPQVGDWITAAGYDSDYIYRVRKITPDGYLLLTGGNSEPKHPCTWRLATLADVYRLPR